MKTLTELGYKFIGVDMSNACANPEYPIYSGIYVKLNNNETVTVQTLYRYGKPAVKTMTVKEYNAWRTDCEKMKNQEG